MTQFASEQNAKPVLQSRSQPDGANKINNAKLERIKQTANRYEKKLMAGVVEPDRIHTTFNDVHAPSETKDALRTITSLQLTRPDAFQYGVLAHNQLSGLLLYGPPGTGKTLFAKAVAKESGATVLEVSGSSVNEMYVGESEKNVGAIFSLARKLSPCIVFIDEADAIFASRSGGRHRVSHREIINQFLKEWDGMEGANVFVMVATNRPFDMDDAVMRRLPRKMLMDLPTEEGREQILRILLKNEALDDSVSLTEFASKTAFYSGSDLKNLCVAAAMACVKQEPETSEKRVLKKGHFETAIAEISASVSEDMSSVQAIRKFDEQYGDRRGRRQKTSLGFMGDAPTESSVRIRG
ncbi:AAA-domain-containing protein [Eremomyces bilateralis CBS 781.70]|uniref:AAA-domain-containing protein n=1 Tax=Eremomyces bilateralis CBS 781.70 TaxID=1392243 RepID=A0A6G1G3C1_9PEZI|nr:AAA-domain-containing protein [Eremomyces bilateralis CBS 781.70]KAF1812508.1 AAA-domain-containing protein [Eremomyces bilateralis CBS 781.70]